MHNQRHWITVLAVLLVAALLLAACPPAEEAPVVEEPAPTPAPEEPEAPPSIYSEAPILAELVAQGALPSVDERLPAEPFVVGPGVLISEEDLPDWTPGRYGGALRSAHSSPDWSPDLFVMVNEPLLIAPGIGTDGIQGNIVRDFEVSDDNTVFTFHMREGLKWSDGEPVTTEDVRFVYEDILLNERLTPSFPARLRTGGRPDGEPMALEILDDYTFRVTFSEPYGGFLRQLTIERWVGYSELLRPKHYLQQFHADYTSLEELRPLLEEQNLTDEWWMIFSNHDCINTDLPRPRCVGFPVLTPWMGVESPSGVLTMERNPYYFKVDTEGQQLPYIDRVVSFHYEDTELVSFAVATGEVDFLRGEARLPMLPMYAEHAEQGGYEVQLLDMHVNAAAFLINRTYDDPAWRSVVEDVRFHQAVSLAIDGNEIIGSVFLEFASLPYQTVGEPYAGYDPEEASRLLDEMGLDQRDADGFRLGPDGETFTILLEHGAQRPDIPLVAELVAQHLQDVGIHVSVRRLDASLWAERRDANELMATIFWSHDRGWDDSYTGFVFEYVGPRWHLWYTTRGEQGEEPPEWVKQAFEMDAARWASVTGSEEYNQLREESLAWHRENLPLITLIEDVAYPLIASDRLGNVPQSGYSIAANFRAEQLFFRE